VSRVALRLRGGMAIAIMLLPLSCHREEYARPLAFVIVPSQDNPFFKAEADAAAQRAVELGYRVRVEAHDDDAYRQDNLIDAAIASGSSILLLDNAGADSSISAVRRATKAGLPVFLIDRSIDAGGIAKAQIIADNAQGAAQVAGSFMKAMDGHGEYAELLGRESDTNAQIRTRGFHSVLDQSSGLKLVEAQSANWSQSEAFQKTETILQSHPHLKGIIAGNDTMALGAAAAAGGAGRRDLIISGFDGSPDAIAAITRNDLLATELQPAVVIARLGIEEADRFRRTGSTGKAERQIIPCELVDHANAADFHGFEHIASTFKSASNQ
jgi:erythritol transport system substrate-binding protein